MDATPFCAKPVSRTVQALQQRYRTQPLNSDELLISDSGDLLAVVSVSADGVRGGLYMTNFRALEQGKGFGTRALRLILAAAVMQGETVRLVARRLDDSSVRSGAAENRRLRDWFVRHGFDVKGNGDRFSGYEMMGMPDVMGRALRGDFDDATEYVVDCKQDQVLFLDSMVSRLGGTERISGDYGSVRVWMNSDQLDALKPFAQDFRVRWAREVDRKKFERAVAIPGVVIDTLDALGYATVSRDSEEALVARAKERYPGKTVKAGLFEEVCDSYEPDPTIHEITAEAFDRAMNVLPPVKLTACTFMSPEPISGSITSVYAEVDGRFFSFSGPFSMSESDILGRVRKGPVTPLIPSSNTEMEM